MTRIEMKAAAKQQISGSILALVIIFLITGLIAGTFVGALLVPALSVSLCAIYLGMTKGTKASIGDMFCRIGTVGKALWLSILIYVFTYLWTLLFIIPGIIKGFSYSMAYYVLAENPNMTAREALNTSKRIMKGHKWELFVLQLSFIGWHLLGMITCGIAYIYVIPYISATTANFYNSIKEPVVVEG